MSAEPVQVPDGLRVHEVLRLPDIQAMIRAMDEQFRAQGAHGSWGMRFHYGPGGRFLTLEFGSAELRLDVGQLTAGHRRL